jgi:diadenosine tetraphosphate (Ap4A) HIT family hydrolase
MAKKSKSRQSSDDCLICRKHTGGATTPGGAIYSDPLIYAGHASFPADETVTYPGILVIEPRRHVPGPEDLTDDEAVAIGLQIARLSRALKARTDAEHIYIFRLGHHVPHLHVFLVPRYPGTPRQYWGVRVDEWPEGPRANAQEIEALCKGLRSFLQDQV